MLIWSTEMQKKVEDDDDVVEEDGRDTEHEHRKKSKKILKLLCKDITCAGSSFPSLILDLVFCSNQPHFMGEIIIFCSLLSFVGRIAFY